MPWPEPTTLRGQHATLEPLTLARHDELAEALRDGELWNLWYTFIPTPDKLAADIEKKLDQQRKGTMLPFAVIDAATGKAVGITTYMNIEAEARRVEIGSTWYRKSVQRTPLNTECKLLLLTHAFESLDCMAVEFRTHFFNHLSRRAIERLGAKLDGILRNHRRSSDGTLRDTAVYSIIASEWPTVRSHLRHQLATRER
ncbi:GNAT family N-acetyltransferase [Steroidobacter sp.]|uniref:GNAT family N-acetyltransferase n=1 Tax=Steroidobacter sp. TaxID=1978227 RepID=UPI001A3BBC98|nr:GNAT family N-acetyltransferase [Steroidobacter sp.]